MAVQRKRTPVTSLKSSEFLATKIDRVVFRVSSWLSIRLDFEVRWEGLGEFRLRASLAVATSASPLCLCRCSLRIRLLHVCWEL